MEGVWCVPLCAFMCGGQGSALGVLYCPPPSERVLSLSFPLHLPVHPQSPALGSLTSIAWACLFWVLGI